MKEHLIDASIELKNSQHVFYDGEPVLGSLNVRVHRWNEESIQDMEIMWRCEIKTKFDECISKDTQLHGKGIVNYLRNKKNLLTEGTHKYSFLLFLPHNIPHSLELKYGSISYVLKAKIKINSSSPSLLQARIPFKVVKNNILHFDKRIPQLVPFSKQIFDRGEIHGNIQLVSTQFLTKDDFEYQIQVQNNSGRGIQWITLKIIQEFDYFVRTSSSSSRQVNESNSPPHLKKTQEITIWRRDFQGVKPFREICISKSHSGVFKDLLPSNTMDETLLMNMCYYLILKFKSYMRSTLLERKIPIIIGTSYTYELL
ncbi:uncharacterized protein [Lepeophtheirus salmonis]|uniref:uncharacterized protein isoform X1 n=2 Tax=Lepeophtheirus salmonis TaxID=72036 RepID=UPI001AE27887|nr:uncharacterized protein LOC121128532 isoform X1 [Lepeophtheirus salmonis]